jgi:hypothetical protein
MKARQPLGTAGVGMGLVVDGAVVHPDRPINLAKRRLADPLFGRRRRGMRCDLPVKIAAFNDGGSGPGTLKTPSSRSGSVAEAAMPKVSGAPSTTASPIAPLSR